MSQQWSPKRLIKGSGIVGLSSLVLLGGCAGNGEENSRSAQAATPEETHYLTDVLEPVTGNASPGDHHQDSSPDNQRQHDAVPVEKTASVNRESKEEEAMTVMVLDALNGHPPVVVPPPREMQQAKPQQAVMVPPEPMRLHFAFDTSELSARDQTRLSAHARFLKANPDYRLQISGHTDASGPQGYNRRLSYRRAQSVALLLKGKGVDPVQLQVTGRGSDQPLAGTDSPHELRRVELDYQPPQLLSRQSGSETRQ